MNMTAGAYPMIFGMGKDSPWVKKYRAAKITTRKGRDGMSERVAGQ